MSPNLIRRRLCGLLCASLACAPLTGRAETPAALQFLTEDWPPFNYEKDGEVKGISTAVVRAIARKLGGDSNIHVLSWNHAYEMALHTPGTVIYSTIRLEEREQLFRWVGPIATNDSYLFENRATPTGIHSLDDARKVHLIAAGSSSNSDYIRLRALGFNNLSNLDTSTNPAQVLLNRRADLGVINPFTLPFNEPAGTHHGELVNTQVLVYSQPIYIAFQRDTPETVVQAWQHALDGMRSSGELKRLTQQALEEASSDYGLTH